MKKIKLVISDLDGTLLNDKHQLGEETKKVIRKLYQQGTHFWIATGRHQRDAERILSKLGVEGLLISANGTTVSNHLGNRLATHVLSSQVIEPLLTFKTPQAVDTNMYLDDHWYMERDDRVFSNYYQEGDFKYTLTSFQKHFQSPVHKIFYTSKDYQALESVKNRIDEVFAHEVDTTFSMSECLEVMPKGINKGSTIESLLREYNLEPEEVVAFGDGFNDLEMLSLVGQGFLMENAHPALAEKLPRCTRIGHYADEAVAKWIAENLLEHP